MSLRSLFVIAGLALLSGCSSMHPKLLADPVYRTTWMGETGLEMLQQAQDDIAKAKASGAYQLNVKLISPGGSIITSLQLAREIEKAKEDGLQVEIHAATLCASGCTFVLGAGSKGHRYINKDALYLVHSIQQGGGFEPPTCVEWPKEENPTNVEDKVSLQLLTMMADYYSRFSGKPFSETKTWIVCGKELVGGGDLAVKLGLADQVE